MLKRGISGVVTAILLILLAIAAVIIVWSVVKPLLEKAGPEGQADCVSVSLGIVSATYAIADPSSGTVVVKREPGKGDLTGITIRIIDSGEDASTKECTLTGGKLDELGTQSCSITGLDAGIDDWKKVEVYAMVGSQKTLCANFETTEEITTAP